MNLLDGTSNLWTGGVNVGDQSSTGAAANQPPVVRPDAATVLAGGSVTIDVLRNDFDPEGGALTVTGATADRGSVTVRPDGTIRYTAPASYSGTARVAYTVRDIAGALSQGTMAVEVVELSIAKGETDSEFVITSVPGELTLTVIEPAEYAGSYVLQTADLAAGPRNLLPPRIRRTAAGGATLTGLSGLWASDEADGPLYVARQWLRGPTPIAGATGLSYVVNPSADTGKTLSLVETASTRAGLGQAASAGLIIPSGARA